MPGGRSVGCRRSWRRGDVSQELTYDGFPCYWGPRHTRGNPSTLDSDGIPMGHYCRGLIVSVETFRGDVVVMYVLYKLTETKLLGYVLNGGRNGNNSWHGVNGHIVIPTQVMASNVDILRMHSVVWNISVADINICSIIAVDKVPYPTRP